MKFVIVLSLIQLAVMAFLAGRILLIEEGLQPDVPVRFQGPPGKQIAASKAADNTTRDNERSIELRLRAIVREELAAQLSPLPNPGSAAQPATAPQPIGEAEYQYRVGSVSQKLDMYESVGSISEQEMHELQSEIVRLNAPDRSQALRRLMRALNSGAVRGHL